MFKIIDAFNALYNTQVGSSFYLLIYKQYSIKFTVHKNIRLFNGPPNVVLKINHCYKIVINQVINTIYKLLMYKKVSIYTILFFNFFFLFVSIEYMINCSNIHKHQHHLMTVPMILLWTSLYKIRSRLITLLQILLQQWPPL